MTSTTDGSVCRTTSRRMRGSPANSGDIGVVWVSGGTISVGPTIPDSHSVARGLP